MDSLSQIVLGAAVSEAALGKKVGNRAIVWGAIAGTIPDLDVISNKILPKIDALAFHRGPTHGIGFSVVFALVMGVCVHYLYRYKHHKYVGLISWLVLIWGVVFALMTILKLSFIGVGISLLIAIGLSYFVYKRYHRASYTTPHASIAAWSFMFFLALFTHPILDTFTTYGTRLFWPFTNIRYTLSSVSIVDPLYTVPFLVCLIIVILSRKGSYGRKFWNTTGLYLSSFYLLFTVFNKTRINTIFENSLSKNELTYTKYMTSPTIFNNILWFGIAETDSTFVFGQYSFLDKEKEFKLHSIPKTSPTLSKTYQDDKTFKTLMWFSDGYALMKPEEDSDNFEYKDLRFGTFRMNNNNEDEFVFRFLLKPVGDHHLEMLEEGGRPKGGNIKEALGVLIKRIQGI
ncbi:MAG: metal-dependent hydrolase [Lewinellaceae bacterium]|nr:metal-dependent hydrolase [Lewinellaceae bacterium]